MSFWQGKCVVVAGGAGMIGQYLCQQLEQAGACVWVVDPAHKRAPIGGANCKLEELHWPATDVLFNLAAKVSGIGYNRLAHYDMAQTNLSPQMAAIDLALKWKCRLVQVSTACVYPQEAPVPTPEEWGWLGNPEPTNSGYGWAKRMGEKLTLWAVAEHGLDAIVARPFNAYGPNDHFEDPNCHVIPALVKRCLTGEGRLQVWGTGTQTRAFVHASDVAKGLMLLAEKAPTGVICNVGHNDQISIGDLANQIIEACWRPGLAIDLDLSQPDGYPARGACTDRLKFLTGWVPDYPLRRGITEVVDACRKWLESGGTEVKP